MPLSTKAYKILLWRHGIVALFSLMLMGIFWQSRLQWGPEMRLWRAVGDASFVILAVVLSIGPLARLWRPASRFTSWRRELGIWFALLALLHSFLIINGWARWNVLRFLGYEFVPQLDRWARLEPGFGLANLLGLVALIWTLVLMATSSNWAIKKLGSTSWKWLHASAYIIFYLIVLHVAYFLFIHYTVSFHRSVPAPNWFRYPMVGIGLTVIALQASAFSQTLLRRHKSRSDNI